MGIFSKLWKGVKKVFKKIGKGIKKVAMKVGKFMDRIGIVGQIGMMLVMPHLGGWLMSSLGAAAKAALASSSAFIRGAGAVLNTAHKFAATAGNVYRTVTGAVKDFIGTAGKYIGGKLGLPGFEKMTLDKAWETYSNDVMKNISSIADPWKQAVTINPGFGTTVAEQARAVGMSPEEFVKNYTMPENVAASMQGLSGNDLANFRFDSIKIEIPKPGLPSNVQASVTTSITEPFQAVRNTDFWGFAPEVTPPSKAWITAPENPGSLIQTDQAPGVTKRVTPVPAEVTTDLGFEEYDPTSSAQQSLLDPASGPRAGAATYPDLGETEDNWWERTKDSTKQAVTAFPGQLLSRGGQEVFMNWAAGDPPEYPLQLRGGVNYWEPSDQSMAFHVLSDPLRREVGIPPGYMGSLAGTNTYLQGSIGATADVWKRWMSAG